MDLNGFDLDRIPGFVFTPRIYSREVGIEHESP